jgi:chromosome segregation ATPase
MAEQNNRSWDEALSALRQAAEELKTVLTRNSVKAEEVQASPGQLKHDLERLQRAGSELQAKLVDSFDRQRPEIVSNLDRERAERTAEQLKRSLEDLASLAVNVTAEVATAAQSSLKQAEPELRTAIRSLEDLASSVSAWITSSIDSGRTRSDSGPTRRPPLDDL